MSSDVVKVDYDSLRSIVDIFDDLLNRCQLQHRRVQSAIQVCMDGAWVGSHADRFYQRMEEDVQTAQQRLISALSQAVEVTNEIERIMRLAEAEAAQFFRYDDAPIGNPVVASQPMPSFHSTPQSQTILIQDNGNSEVSITFPEDGVVAYNVAASDDDGMRALLTNMPTDNADQTGINLTGTGTIVGRSDMNPNLVLVQIANEDGFGAVWVDLQNSPGITLGQPLTNLPVIPTSELLGIPSGIEAWSTSAPQNLTTLPIATQDIDGIIQFAVQDSARYPSLPDFRHPGIDFITDAGTPVYSLTDGEVVGVYIPQGTTLPPNSPYVDASGRPLVGGVFDPGNMPQGIGAPGTQVSTGIFTDSSPGAYVVVRTGDTYIAYEHLDPTSIQVGEYVLAGQPIGTVGDFTATADNWGNHLHLEVRVHDLNGVAIYDNGTYQPSASTPSIAVNPQIMFDQTYWQNDVVSTMVTTTFNDSGTNPNVLNGSGGVVQNTWGINIGAAELMQQDGVTPLYNDETPLNIDESPFVPSPTPTQEA